MHNPGPLAGVRILDLSSVVSGPMASVLLADQGAEVIKLEHPESGDMTRYMGAMRNGFSALFAVVNRNKKSVAIDLKTDQGIAIFKQLLCHCDVLLENFRPQKMAALGLSYQHLKADFPDLIYASINGLGEHGPLKDKRVFDFVIQALSGLTQVQGKYLAQPQMVRSIICDKIAALTAAQGITAALFQREQKHKAADPGGQYLRLSMLDAMVSFNWPDLMTNYSFVDEPFTPGMDMADGFSVCPTADGYMALPSPPTDQFAHLTTAQLQQVLDQQGVPCGVVLTPEQLLASEQLNASKLIKSHNHPIAGPMQMPRLAQRFGDQQLPIQAAPELGQHTWQVLQQLCGLQQNQLTELAAQHIINADKKDGVAT